MKIALLGNPNAGKSSLFNQLTGLNQKVGNFPGVTVDKRSGWCKLPSQKVEIIDLPGTYSLYPKSTDEGIVLQTLLNRESPDYPDLLVVVADASNLKRNLLLFTQVRDLGLPSFLALNMMDIAEEKGLSINCDTLRRALNCEVVSINARQGKNIELLKKKMDYYLQNPEEVRITDYPYLATKHLADAEMLGNLSSLLNATNDYQSLHYAHHYQKLTFLNDKQQNQIASFTKEFDSVTRQSQETLARYEIIEDILQESLRQQPPKKPEGRNLSFGERLDQVLLHWLWGYLIFFGVLLVIFQSIFTWASYPMDMIDLAFGNLQEFTKNQLPAGVFTNLLADGIIAGLGGIVIFIPQIALLFMFIALLEESGYMARVMFIMDKLMRPFGLNGKSVVPLISGVACAVPAIMATRSIDHWKERLITIFVTPLMACSARLPVYAVLIALVVPEKWFLGLVSWQGLALLALYLLGLLAALLSAWLLNGFLRSEEKSFLIMEMPHYQLPRWRSVLYVMYEKSQIFVWEAGRIILAISVILWVAASYGPGDSMKNAEILAKQQVSSDKPQELEDKIASLQLEASYAGQFGKLIEPAIAPLGYDWKIGIALITSFAAREVFVGSISTIYSIGSQDENLNTVKKRMAAEINPDTGAERYTPAVAFSLLVFYAFAMQCMSTVAIVYRETKSWRWPALQFVYFTSLAYLSSLLVYNLLS